MLSTDKTITIGMGVVTAATLYYLGGRNLPARALYSSLGGMTATTLFQTYYPIYLESLKSVCGEKLTKALIYLSPVMVFVGGYVGGLPFRVNLLATAVFMVTQFIAAQMAHPCISNQYKEEVKTLCTQVERRLADAKLSDAEKFIEQADNIESRRSDLKNYAYVDFTTAVTIIDKVKVKLIESYLTQKPPNIEKAENCADSIKDESLRIETQVAIVAKKIQLDPKAQAWQVILEKMRNVTPSKEGMQKLIKLKDEGHADKDFVLLLLNYGLKYVNRFGDTEIPECKAPTDSHDPEDGVDGLIDLMDQSLYLYLLRTAMANKQDDIAKNLVECSGINILEDPSSTDYVRLEAYILLVGHFVHENNLDDARTYLEKALDGVTGLSDESQKREFLLRLLR
ncbi:hypothetical protein [Simkania sp.]|uniref:hypothetical protein n=1 Tax=Simkania sp. TaxID=34094 RepID=UPI003B519D1B